MTENFIMWFFILAPIISGAILLYMEIKER